MKPTIPSIFTGAARAVICLAFAVSAQALSAQGASLISNGDFETGSVTGWGVRAYSQLNPAVVATTTEGWGGHALKLNRENNTFSNPPGISQTFTASGADLLHVSFDYQLAANDALIFRIVAVSGENQYVYNGTAWTAATISQNTKSYQQDWGANASNKTGYNNLAARTALLTSTTGIVASYSLDLALYSSDSITYRIDFFNPKTNTTVYIDNVSVTTTAIPEPATWTLLLGLASVAAGIWKLRRLCN
ncbi:hypothetical protein Ga0100231_012995 [Opitutaceae bacterium TAV4]|nr:hypothetical protein Ga0100231_012995 [Opitutaceae bacterium TAV4]RRJ99346.1 hypothetical protein Ga0100230_014290 [Opitutaceae bacterium TAV3]